MRLNLHLLRVFHKVVTAGSFSAAARELHISQPAVSKAVAELERQLELVLIERGGSRSGQGLNLTETGQALREHARAIFALEHAAVEELQARSGLKRGELVVGASTTIASYWLPRYLRQFSLQWPDILIKVVAANTQTVVDELYDCRLDLALVEGPVHKEGVAYYPWKEERLVIIAGPEHLTLQAAEEWAPPRRSAGGKAVLMRASDLGNRTWLMRENGSGTREVTAKLLNMLHITPGRCIEIGSNEGIARAAAAGLGMAMLPFAVVEDLMQLGKLVEVKMGEMPGLSRTLYRLERKDRPVSPAAGAFLDILSRPS